MTRMSESLMHLHFLSLLLLSCVSPSSSFLVDDLVACRPDQIQALTQFKNEFDTRSCNHSDSSNKVVICDYSTGAITNLILTACLSGTLMPNSSLFKLHHLRYLNLSGNNFISSSIPSQIGNLNRLEVLSLSSNGFIGQVPSSFSNLKLTYLELSKNELTGSFPFLRNLNMLTVLDLSNNHFSGILNPNSSLFQFHHLQYLSLEGNKFLSSSLPYEFGNLNKLEVLSLSSNGFLGQVPSSFSNLSKLTYLGLSKNKLTGSFPFLRNLSMLTSLDLSNNHFSGILNPNSSLFVLHQLQYLNLSDNNFIPSSLPSEFGNLNSLNVLSLSSNGFLGQVPPSFSNLSHLTYLELSNNKLTGSFPLLQNLSMLESLDLQHNHFSGVLNSNSSLFELHQLRYLNLALNSFSSSLPYVFGNLNKLETLSLDSNDFSGQVPPTISNLTQLTDLYLSDNRFTGSFPLVQNLTKLSVLELSTNNFSGTISSSIFTMPFLSVLNLHENNLNGSIEVPNSSTSSSLETLYLGNNHFEGKILEPISKLTNLQQLDLSYLNTSYPIDLNLFSSFKSLFTLDISGHNIFPTSLSSDSYIPLALKYLFLMHCDIKEFPDFLKILQNLEVLNMLGNGMNGKIPEWLWSLPRLNSVFISNNSFNGFEGSAKHLVNSSVEFLALDGNRFKGALPHLPLSIKYFFARKNAFKGDIPLSICNRRSLSHLGLSYNNLTGPVPQCLSKLTVVILRKNNLEGSIPDKFYVGSSLQTLDIGYNRLTGKLPRSLLNCSYLQFLSLDNNKIKDTFPFWLRALPDLQILTLRSNEFYGPISTPHQGPLGFPELRIFEISNNKFTGSLPPSYFVNWKASALTINEDQDLYMLYYLFLDNITDYSNVEYIDLQYKGLHMEQVYVLTSYATIDFSGNRLEGQIPESIGLLKALFALNLSNNAFTGHIPFSLTNLTELESLDLSSNQLSGTIPNGLGSLSFLEYINVSHNQLKGEIPQGTQITGQPKSSFEGNAWLCGLPLEQTCFGTNAPSMQQPEQENEEEQQVLSWKAVAIGYGLGVLFGLSIAQVIASYKPEWLSKMIGPTKRRNR